MEKECLGNLANAQGDTAQKSTSKKSIDKKATDKKTIGERAVAKIVKPDQKLQESTPKIIRKQPDRKAKRKPSNEPTKECTNFDVIEVLLSNYGMTGENLARQILSFMDFRSITKIRFVSKSWNKFLTEDRILMLKIVRRAEPYLEDLCCKLSNESRRVTKREQWEKISLYKSDDYFCCNKYFNPGDPACGFDCGYGCTSDPEESEPDIDPYYTESGCLIDGPDSDGYTFESDGHSRGWCKCFPKPEKPGPYAKFDREIEQNSEESSEWKEFFDSIEKKEEIKCKKIFQLGKKIHCIFAFAQNWQFDEEFKGYFLGQKDYKEIHDEIKSETRFKNCFERKLHEHRLEDGVFVDRLYTEEPGLLCSKVGTLLCRIKYSMNHMLKSIKKEINRFAKEASETGAQGGSDPAGGDDGADGSKNKGQGGRLSLSLSSDSSLSGSDSEDSEGLLFYDDFESESE